MEVKKEEEIVKVISQLASLLSEQAKKEVAKQLSGELESNEKEFLPVSIFSTELSGLESIVVYLKDNQKLTVKEIAAKLNRELTTIYTTYHQAKTKFKIKLPLNKLSLSVPLNLFSQRQFAVLEILVTYLKEEKKLSFKEISELIKRNYSTIKTVYRRYQNKKWEVP